MKKAYLKLTAVLIVSFLSGCATSYQEMTAFTLTGGYYDKDLGDNVRRVGFSGNGYTTDETVQTLWLYRCAELTVEEGFDGFKILSNISLTEFKRAEDVFSGKSANVEKAQYYVPMYIPEVYKPIIEADILLIKGPIKEKPPTVFDAYKLKQALEFHLPEKRENVEPHIHDYIYPEYKSI